MIRVQLEILGIKEATHPMVVNDLVFHLPISSLVYQYDIAENLYLFFRY